MDEMYRQKEFIRLIKDLDTDCPKKYTINTYGCQMNENDSERIAGMLDEMGYLAAPDANGSDLIIFNTCCVRENAELKVYGHLGALKKLKEKKPGLIIALCGCMMQQEAVVDRIRKKYRHVDLVFGTHNIHKLPEYLYNILNSKIPVFDIWESEDAITEGMPVKRNDGIKAWVTVMYGCNNYCSYCIVPYVRGRERSRAKEDIIDEIRALGQQGYKEITLLGQNVNSYGKDFKNVQGFSDLLYEIDTVEGIRRVRFMTSHPRDLSDDLIRAMKNCEKVCEHLHLPIQAGSSRILNEMNRHYTKEQYLELIEKIRDNIPGTALTTDIMIGFPGESDVDFKETLDVVNRVRFDTAYTFIYSVRNGTPAAKRNDRVPEDIIKKRFEKLVEAQNKISREINDNLTGTTMEVLVEGLSKMNMENYTGRTRTNKIVNFKGNSGLIGKFVNIKIEKVGTWSLEGKKI